MVEGEPPKLIASATSGADGSFVLTVPPADRLFRVRAEGAGIVPVLFEGVYDASEIEDLGEHILPHGEKLSGIAVDSSGKPLAGAVVSLEPGVAGGDDLAYRVVMRTAVTGEDGKFQFEEASATGNRITIEKTGLAPARETGLRAGALPRPIAVAAGDPVTGVVLGAGRKPAAGALVRLEKLEGDDALGRDGLRGAFHDSARARRARRDRRRRRRGRLGKPAGREAASRRGEVAHDHARAARVARRQGRRRQNGSRRAAREGLRQGERIRPPRAHGTVVSSKEIREFLAVLEAVLAEGAGR